MQVKVSWTDVVLSNHGLSPFMAVYCAIMDCEHVLAVSMYDCEYSFTVSMYNCEYVFREGVTWSPPYFVNCHVQWTTVTSLSLPIFI